LASAGVTGALSGTDWTTFNNKQNALTNPVTGTGTTNYLPKFTGTSTIGNSIVQEGGAGILISGTDNFTSQNGGWFFNGSGNYASGIFASSSSNILTLRSPQNISFQIGFSTPSMTLTSGGNLLVGTTTDIGQRLQVSGGYITQVDGGVRTFLGYDGSGSLIGTTTNHYFRFITNDTERMRITSGGNVLIGTTTDVGSARRELVMRGANGSVISLGNNTTADRFQIASDSGENALINNKANTPMIFYTSNAEAMRITSGGNVGIGTSSPLSKLHVNTGTNQNFRVRPGTDVGATNGIALNSRTDDDGSLQQLTLRASDVIMLTSGNVGIGTSSPGFQLQIQNVSQSTFLSVVTLNTGTAGILLGDTDSATVGRLEYDNSANFMSFYTNGSERARITSGGNLLVGTTTDVGARLHVNGAVRTGAPSGGSAVDWRLGTARGGTITPNAIVRVEIGGVLVDLDARYV
jgi:hypothetical protein